MSTTERVTELPDATGHFGPYGGRFVPETLVVARSVVLMTCS